MMNFDQNYTIDNRSSLLLTERANGLMDAINKSHQELWDLYKKFKSLDWDELEQDLTLSAQEFASASRKDFDTMIFNIVSQWELDTMAARHYGPILALFEPADPLWCMGCQITANENVHALSYPEIVRSSFPGDPNEVFDYVRKLDQALTRMSTVEQAVEDARRVGMEYQMGKYDRNDPVVRDAAMMFVAAFYMMERHQFMPSFDVTFSYGEASEFVQAAKLIQKIALDEFNFHVKTGRYVLNHELSTEVGRASMERIRPKLLEMLNEVRNREYEWIDFMLDEDRAIPGQNLQRLRAIVDHASTDVATLMGLPMDFTPVTEFPICASAKWLDIGRSQSAPQEDRGNDYLLGGFKDTGIAVFDTDGL